MQKKWELNCLKFELITFAVSLMFVILDLYMDNVGLKYGYRGFAILAVMFGLAIVWGIICDFCISRYRYITGKDNEFKNIFDNLDFFKSHWRETNNYYIRRIGTIHYFYNESENIEKLVKEKRLDVLWERYSEVSKRDDFIKNFTVAMDGIIISVISSYIIKVNIHKSISGKELFLIVIVVGILFTISFREYMFKGKGGTLEYRINEFELKEIQKKIEEIQNSINMNENEVKLLYTQQVLYQKLVKNNKQFRMNENNINDIMTLDKLRLFYDGELGEMKWKESMVYFPEKTEEEREKIVKENKDLKILYEMLKENKFTS